VGGVFQGDRVALVAQRLDLRQHQGSAVVRRAVPGQPAERDESVDLGGSLAQDNGCLRGRDSGVVDHPGLPEQWIDGDLARFFPLIGCRAPSLTRTGCWLSVPARSGAVALCRGVSDGGGVAGGLIEGALQSRELFAGVAESLPGQLELVVEPVEVGLQVGEPVLVRVEELLGLVAFGLGFGVVGFGRAEALLLRGSALRESPVDLGSRGR
jgi:hypothetical protein